MRTPASGMTVKYLAIVILLTVLTLTVILAKGCKLPSIQQKRVDRIQWVESEIQKIIDHSNTYLQAAETYFKEKNYQAAREAYSQATDIITESHFDFCRHTRLKEHFQHLNDRIVRLQIAVSQAAFIDALDGLVARKSGDSSSGAPATAGTEALQQAPPYDPSLLNVLAVLELKKEEERAEGKAKVKAAIAKAGHRDFWKICELELLPRETRNCVPNILATIVIGKDPQRYGFDVKPAKALAFDTVMAKILVNLRLVADAIDVSYESLLALNPELRHGITPPGMAYRVRIPTGERDRLVSMLRGIPPNRLATWRMVTAREDDTLMVVNPVNI